MNVTLAVDVIKKGKRARRDSNKWHSIKPKRNVLPQGLPCPQKQFQTWNMSSCMWPRIGANTGSIGRAKKSNDLFDFQIPILQRSARLGVCNGGLLNLFIFPRGIGTAWFETRLEKKLDLEKEISWWRGHCLEILCLQKCHKQTRIGKCSSIQVHIRLFFKEATI